MANFNGINEHFLPCYVYINFEIMFLDFVFRKCFMIKDQTSNFAGKRTFGPFNFFYENRDGHSKPEGMEIFDAYLLDDITKDRHQLLK